MVPEEEALAAGLLPSAVVGLDVANEDDVVTDGLLLSNAVGLDVADVASEEEVVAGKLFLAEAVALELGVLADDDVLKVGEAVPVAVSVGDDVGVRIFVEEGDSVLNGVELPVLVTVGIAWHVELFSSEVLPSSQSLHFLCSDSYFPAGQG